MTMPPDMARALVEARQRDVRAGVQRGRMPREAHEARAVRRERRAAEAALRIAPERRRRRFGFAWLLGSQ